LKTQRNFASLTTQRKFSPAMIVYLSATLPKDDPMQIDKPLTEQKKER
jgi:hypothetical protein